MMRLCLFTDSLEPSGMGEHMLRLAAEFRQHYHVSFALPPSPMGDRLLARAAALELSCLPVVARPDLTGNDLLSGWLLEQQIDLFHSHAGIGWEGHSGIYAARAAGVPLVVRTEHLPFLITDHREHLNHHRLMGSVDRLVCVSRDAYESFVQNGVPRAKLRVVRNGTTPAVATRSRRQVRAELGLLPQTPLVLSVGRLDPQKNYPLLIAAMQEISVRLPEVRLLIVGDGWQREELAALIAAHGLQAHVRLLGQRNDVADLLQAADLFVLPSQFEGLPLSVLEAMAAGLPVVGTRVSGIAETVVDGLTGHLVELGDVSGLAHCITTLLLDRRQASQLGTAGRQEFEQRWSAQRMAAEMDEVYQQLRSLPHAQNTGRLHWSRDNRRTASRQSGRV